MTSTSSNKQHVPFRNVQILDGVADTYSEGDVLVDERHIAAEMISGPQTLLAVNTVVEAGDIAGIIKDGRICENTL